MTTNPDSVSLTTKLTQASDRLQIRYSVHNGHSAPILVFNRFWLGGAQREADTQQLYRFVTAHGLRLLLGAAPLPRRPVTVRNLPEVTKIEAFGSFEEELATPLPATEYSCYHTRASAAERVVEQVEHVELFVRYVEAAGIELMPSQIHSGAWRAVNAAAMGNHQTLRSGPIALHLDVLRQTGEYSRLVLPQDQTRPPAGP